MEKMTNLNSIIIALIACVPSLTLSIGLLRSTIDTKTTGLKTALLQGAKSHFKGMFLPPKAIDDLSAFEANAQLHINTWLYFGAALLALLSIVAIISTIVITSSRRAKGRSRWEHAIVLWG